VTLFDLCKDLFTYLVRFRELAPTTAAPPLHQARAELLGLIHRMDAQARPSPSLARPYEQVRYALVALADEVLTTSGWEQGQRWEQIPLEQQLYGTRQAAEQFFTLLEGLDGASSDVCAIYYLCLALGFSGRYQPDDPQLAEIKNRLLDRLPGGVPPAGMDPAPPDPEGPGRGAGAPARPRRRALAWAGAGLLAALALAAGLALWPQAPAQAPAPPSTPVAKAPAPAPPVPPPPRPAAKPEPVPKPAPKPAPVPPQPPPVAPKPPPAQPAPVKAAPAPAPAATPAEPAPKPPAPAPTAPPPQAPAPAAAPQKQPRYRLQVAVFVGPKQSGRLAAKLKALGWPARVERQEGRGGRLWYLVVVQPVIGKDNLKEIQDKLVKDFGLTPIVRRLRP